MGIFLMNDVIFRCIFEFGQGRSDINFDQLSCAFSHSQIVLTAHIFLNISRKIVTGNTNGFISYDSAQRDYGNFGGTATYVNDHV